MLDEVVGTNPENGAKLLEGEYTSLSKLFGDFRKIFEEFLGSVEVGEGLFVDIASATLIIHQSNSVIENGPDFLNLGLALA